MLVVRVDLEKRHIEWDFFHPYITIVGKYEISGQVLILPIRGKGGANITLCKSLLLDYTLTYLFRKLFGLPVVCHI
jgi:hypothetical protein